MMLLGGPQQVDGAVVLLPFLFAGEDGGVHPEFRGVHGLLVSIMQRFCQGDTRR
jgi:hypothetical protein